MADEPDVWEAPLAEVGQWLGEMAKIGGPRGGR